MTQKKYNTKCINTVYWYIKSMKSLTKNIWHKRENSAQKNPHYFLRTHTIFFSTSEELTSLIYVTTFSSVVSTD